MFGTDITIQGGPFVEARFYRHETNQMLLSPIFLVKKVSRKNYPIVWMMQDGEKKGAFNQCPNFFDMATVGH